MEAPFKIGQKVIALASSKRTEKGFRVVKDTIYTVGDCFQCPKCLGWHVGLEEFSDLSPTPYRCCNRNLIHVPMFYGGPVQYFAPIEYKDFTAEIAAGSTETKEQPDKVIIPAKPETAPCENSFS